jgi:ATPase subunit of ABC transporter with duplicated ATPase domains
MPELTAQELWDQTDFAERKSIQQLFPVYIQEQIALKETTKKDTYPKNVDIDNFTLKTPFGDQELLKQTELILEANKRQCLYGANGTGKTLLFSYMNEGKIKGFPKHLHVHHCKELENHELSDTVLNTVVNCYPYLNILRKINAKIQALLAAADCPEDKKAGYQANLDYVQWNLSTLKADDAEEKAKKMLRVLGFDEFAMAKQCVALSGGLRMRVALCIAFFIEADLLLLDEPTNHLDFPSVLWLENRLRAYRGSFLLVSHDRELLNNVCMAVLLLEDKQIKYYAMGFSEFEKQKDKEDKKKFDEIEKFLQKNVNVDPSTMLGRQKYEKKIWSDNYYARQIAIAGKFTFPEAVPLSNTEKDADGKLVKADDISLIDLKDVTFSYNVDTGVWIFKDPISFKVTATTRVGVMGPNGAGKSTLLKLLTHKLTAVTGSVVHHPKYTLAYFGQHSTAELDMEKTAMEFMQEQFPEESTGTLRNHLAKTSIVGTVADTRMERLSFSQRSCIIFSKLTFICPHLLIMDEPTNFLDLESVDSLIAACNKYRGALLLVSHNRDFLRKCAKQYLSVVPGQFLMFNGMKEAERSTYNFIAVMEDGGKVGANALKDTPGGGSVHSSQRAGGVVEEKKSKDGVLTIGGGSIAPKPVAAKPVAVVYKEGDKVSALWNDGKWYPAVIKKVDKEKYTILYTEYNNTAQVTIASLKKEVPKAAPAAAGAKAAPAAAKAGGKK